jgi:hypothetical protein
MSLLETCHTATHIFAWPSTHSHGMMIVKIRLQMLSLSLACYSASGWPGIYSRTSYKRYISHHLHAAHHLPTQTQMIATTMKTKHKLATNNFPSQSLTSLTHITNLAFHTLLSPLRYNSPNPSFTNPGQHQNSTSSNTSYGQVVASTGHLPPAAKPPLRA